MKLYDTHCHLDMYNEDVLNEIIKNLELKKISKINTICTKISNFEKILQISKKHSNIFCTIGQHPEEKLEENFTNIYEKMTELLKIEKDKVVAIGEIGLDWHLDLSNEEKNTQEKIFIEQINFAIDNNFPIIVHSRPKRGEEVEFEDRIISILKESKIDRCVFHSFTGNQNMARRIFNLGYFISFSGIITFKNANEIQEAARISPLDRILIETDGPFLTPEPHRGKSPNLPGYVEYVLKKISEIKNISIIQLSEQIYQNSTKFF